MQKRVLIVDDSADQTFLLGKLLEILDCQVRIANDGLTALDAYREFRPHVVFLDLGLPKLDGFEVCRRIRQQPGCESVLIAIISGYGRDEDKRQSIEAGANIHFLKPVDHGQIIRLLADVKT